MWHNGARVPLQEIRDAADKIVKAAEAFDLTSMGIACQEQRDAVEQVQQRMPSPDPDLTAQLQKALSDYSAAATICTTAVENRNLDDFKQAATLVDEANNYMDEAQKILQADLGNWRRKPFAERIYGCSRSRAGQRPTTAEARELGPRFH